MASPAPPPLRPPPYAPGHDDEESYNLWYIGVLIMAVGTFCQAIGANLQQRSAQREAELHSDPAARRPARKQPLFVLGVVMLVSAGERVR